MKFLQNTYLYLLIICCVNNVFADQQNSMDSFSLAQLVDQDPVTVFSPQDIKTEFNDINLYLSSQDAAGVESVIAHLRQDSKKKNKKDVVKEYDDFLERIYYINANPTQKNLFVKYLASQASCELVFIHTSALLELSEERIHAIFHDVLKKHRSAVIVITEVETLFSMDIVEDSWAPVSQQVVAVRKGVQLLKDAQLLKSSKYNIFLCGMGYFLDPKIFPGEFLEYLGLGHWINFDRKLAEDEILLLIDPVLKEVKGLDLNIRIIARLLAGFTKVEVESFIQEILDLNRGDLFKKFSMKSFVNLYNNKIHGLESLGWEYYLLSRNEYSSAIHEAGHAVAGVYGISSFSALFSITIATRNLNGGFNHFIPLKLSHDFTYDNYKKLIEGCLSGGIAEQIFGMGRLQDGGLGRAFVRLRNFGYAYIASSLARAALAISEKTYWVLMGMSFAILTTFDVTGDNPPRKGFEDYLFNLGVGDKDSSTTDVGQAYRLAREMIELKLTDKTEDQIVQECYEDAYQFIMDHKNEVKTLADLLLKEKTITGDEVYDILQLDKPLFDYELAA